MPDDYDEKRRLTHLRENLARDRAQMSHNLSLQRQREKESAQHYRQELAINGDLDAMKLAHQLDPEVRERDFSDLVREENLRLQSLGTELSLRWQYEKAEKQLEHKQVLEQLQAEMVRLKLQSKLKMAEMEKEEALEEQLLHFKAILSQKFGTLSEDKIKEIMDRLVEQEKV